MRSTPLAALRALVIIATIVLVAWSFAPRVQAGVQPSLSLDPTEGPPGTSVSLTLTASAGSIFAFEWDGGSSGLADTGPNENPPYHRTFVIPDDASEGTHVFKVVNVKSKATVTTGKFIVRFPTATAVPNATRTPIPTSVPTELPILSPP